MKNLLQLILITIAAFIFSACGSSGGGSGSGDSVQGESGTLRVQITDAPFPFSYVKSASVIIKEVWIRHSDGSGFERQLPFTPSEVNLVPLVGGVTQLLIDTEIPAGTYDQARLIVEAGTVELKNSAFVQGDRIFNTAKGNLKFPSASQSGIKVNIDPPINVATQLSGDLTLDFDLTKSFVFNGPPTHSPGVKRVLFKPVVRAVNTSENGRITLRVLSDNYTPGNFTDDTPLSGVTVTALDQTGAEQAVTSSNSDGNAWIQLADGTYDIRVEADGFNSVLIEDKKVFVGNETSIGDVILAKTPGRISGIVMGDAATPGADDDIVLKGVSVTLVAAGDSQPLAISPPGENPVLTDTQGAYQFDDLSASKTYDITFEKQGYQNGYLAGTAATTSGFAPTVTLVQTFGTLTIKVFSNNGTPLDPADDTVISGATVSVLNQSGIEQKTVSTNASGEAQIIIDPGMYDIAIEVAGHNPGDVQDVEVFTSQETDSGNVTLEMIIVPPVQ